MRNSYVTSCTVSSLWNNELKLNSKMLEYGAKDFHRQ